ncbi:serine hydrolase domain-containing protein [uncultured Winogradskyella sp.]|uniref:serine hydrolase domain-containing protein n=1 Tax=uncultured Winogradskyella sp. TaxID=395353 RepID=UPI0026249198|nr:serine hydrolase domain-containing protein [uncultured Winogradskyella sp.]
MRLLCFIMTLCFIASCEGQKKSENKALEERISRIENGLQSNLRVQYGDSVNIQYFNIEDRLKELNIPGVSIAVMNNGVVEWARGYGMADTSQNKKVTTKTLFQAGSVSKPIAATRALQLVEEGQLNLDSNVNDYLRSWKVSENEFTVKEKVTLRRLLNHSAGLTVHGFPGYSIKDTIPSIIDVLDGKGNTDPVRVFRAPGEKVGYSGGGYTVMQLMVSDLEQKEFSDIMQKNVLNPLGMTSSTYENPLPKAYHSIAAAGYKSDGSQVAGKWHTYPEMAAAGLWTTPSQLLLWAKTIQDTYQNQKDGFLKTQTVNEMLKDYGNNQGMGPYVVEDLFGHGGSDEGFVSDLRIWKAYPISVAIMVNSDNGNDIIQELFLSIAKEYNLPGIYHRLRKYNEQSKAQRARYVGAYQFSEDAIAKVKIKDNGLEFSEGLVKNPIFLLPETDTLFFSSKSGLYFEFVFENDLVTNLKVAGYNGQKMQE